MTSATPWRSWLGGAVALVSVLAVVVGVAVLASGAGDGDTATSAPNAAAAPGVFDAVVVFVGLCGLAVVVLIVIGMIAAGDRKAADFTVQRTAGGAALLVLVFAFVLAANPFDSDEGMLGSPDGAPRVAPEESEVARDVPPDAPPPLDAGRAVSTLSMVVGAVAFLGLVTLVVALAVTRRRIQREVAPPSDEAEDHTRSVRRDRMIGLLDDAIEGLRSHPDPREAVVSAWVRLEDAFVIAGVEREPTDTPLRYLGRALRTVDASAPAVERLTGSFEAALFSTHPIGPDTQADAVDALVSVRDELQVL